MVIYKLNNWGKIKNGVQNVWTLFLDMVFPKECLSCGREGEWLCADCFAGLKIEKNDRCLFCGFPSPLGRTCPVCSCNFYLDGIFSPGDYGNPVIAELIKKMKYGFVQEISLILANFMVLFVDKLNKSSGFEVGGIIGRDALIIPVPLHKRRMKWRGFNQAEAIAGKFAASLGMDMDNSSLTRIVYRQPQVKLKGEKRRENVKGNFYLNGNVAGKNIILVDDVVTTGSTLNECARVLKEGGALTVFGLTAARG